MKKRTYQPKKTSDGQLKKMPKFESVGYPRPLYGDVEGSLYDIPGYRALGRKGSRIAPLEAVDLIPLLKESQLYSLPERKPMLWKKEEIEILPHPLTAVGAVLPDNYIFNALPAYQTDEETKAELPPLAYAPLSCWQNLNWVAATKLKYREPKDYSQISMFSPDQKMQSLAGLEEALIPKGAWELELLFCPGVTDSPGEMKKWQGFFQENQPKSIRITNLTCDWDTFIAGLPQDEDEPVGLLGFLKFLKKAVPEAELDQIEMYWK